MCYFGISNQSKMKRTILFSLVLLLASNTYSQTNWFDGTYEEALAEAKKQNKYLFIDCYTDWCSWCKVADKKTFPTEEVASFLNENFVSVKVDMERGEGVYLGMKYRVMGYPSYLMFTSDGSFAHRMSGYIENPTDFVAEVKNALDESNRSAYPSKLTDKVEFPEFYVSAFTNKDIEQKRSNPDESVVNEWLGKQKDLTDEVAWSVLYRFPLKSKYNNLFLETKAEYVKLYGEKEVMDKVSGIGNGLLRAAMESKKESDLNIALDFADKYLAENKEATKSYYRLRFCEGVGDWKGYADCAQGIIDREGLANHLGGVNNYGWTIYLNAEDKDVLTKASKWMLEVVKLDPLYMYLDTYAALLFKSGKYDEAIDWATKAINTGKDAGENVQETEELRDQIIAAKEGK